MPLKFAFLEVLVQNRTWCTANHHRAFRRYTNPLLFICAGTESGVDSCHGDSGGPFFCFDDDANQYYSAGTVSFGHKCGTGLGAQYVKTAAYLDWITHYAFPDVIL